MSNKYNFSYKKNKRYLLNRISIMLSVLKVKTEFANTMQEKHLFYFQ
jgi:hypothetical protein